MRFEGWESRDGGCWENVYVRGKRDVVFLSSVVGVWNVSIKVGEVGRAALGWFLYIVLRVLILFYRKRGDLEGG